MEDVWGPKWKVLQKAPYKALCSAPHNYNPVFVINFHWLSYYILLLQTVVELHLLGLNYLINTLSGFHYYFSTLSVLHELHVLDVYTISSSLDYVFYFSL